MTGFSAPQMPVLPRNLCGPPGELGAPSAHNSTAGCPSTPPVLYHQQTPGNQVPHIKTTTTPHNPGAGNQVGYLLIHIGGTGHNTADDTAAKVRGRCYTDYGAGSILMAQRAVDYS